MEGAKWGSLVQFNEADRHFRCLKGWGKTVTVLDGVELLEKREMDWKERDEVVFEKGWKTYMGQFNKVGETWEEKGPRGEGRWRCLERVKVGGAEKRV